MFFNLQKRDIGITHESDKIRKQLIKTLSIFYYNSFTYLNDQRMMKEIVKKEPKTIVPKAQLVIVVSVVVAVLFDVDNNRGTGTC